MKEVIDIFVGYDSTEIVAYHVLCQSIISTTSSGIGCRLAAIIRRRCEGLIYLKEMGEEGRGHWVFPLSPTESPRRLSSDSWSR
jgi:hypothetical protein